MYGISGFGALACALAGAALPSDPKVGRTDEGGLKFSLGADAGEVLGIPQLRYLLLASFLRFCSGLCIGVWSAPYFQLAFPDSAKEYAVVNACIVGFCGVSSALFGGYLADALAQSTDNRNVGRMLVPVLGSLFAAPTFYLCVHASSFHGAMGWLALSYLVAESWFGPTIAVLQSTAGNHRGGTAQGIFTLVGAFANFAPTLLGFWYQNQQVAHTAANSHILADSLGFFVCLGYLFSAFVFFLALNSQRDLINP